MRSIKGVNTSPELLVRKYLFKLGYRYRLHVKKLPGKPDMVLKKYKTVIFIDGCFWHGHSNCHKSTLPKTHVEFWTAKIERNKMNDESNRKKLNSLGWRVIVIYQCELKNRLINQTMQKLLLLLHE